MNAYIYNDKQGLAWEVRPCTDAEKGREFFLIEQEKCFCRIFLADKISKLVIYTCGEEYDIECVENNSIIPQNAMKIAKDVFTDKSSWDNVRKFIKNRINDFSCIVSNECTAFN